MKMNLANLPITFKLLRFYVILFTFLPVCLQAQVLNTESPWLQRDKLVHFSWAAGFTPAVIQVLEVKGVRHAEIKGAALLFGAGVAKELFVDKKSRFPDIAVNFVGCIAGIYLNRLLVRTYQKNHDKKHPRQLLLPTSP